MKEEDSLLPVFKLNGEVFIEPGKGIDGFYSKIIGIKEQLYIIIDNPLSREKSDLIPPLTPVWIRYFHEIIYRFKSRILKVIHEPTPLLFVQFPLIVEKIEYRKDGRKKVFIQAYIYDLHQKVRRVAVRGYILDISMTGALILADLTHLIEKDVLLVFRVPWLKGTFNLKARVLRCEASKDGVRSGVQFFDLSNSNLIDLEKMIRSIERGEFFEML